MPGEKAECNSLEMGATSGSVNEIKHFNAVYKIKRFNAHQPLLIHAKQASF